MDTENDTRRQKYWCDCVIFSDTWLGNGIEKHLDAARQSLRQHKEATFCSSHYSLSSTRQLLPNIPSQYFGLDRQEYGSLIGGK